MSFSNFCSILGLIMWSMCLIVTFVAGPSAQGMTALSVAVIGAGLIGLGSHCDCDKGHE